MEHAFKRQVFIKLRPMNAAIGQLEIFPLLFRGIFEVGPSGEGVAGDQPVLCPCIDPFFVGPDLFNPVRHLAYP